MGIIFDPLLSNIRSDDSENLTDDIIKYDVYLDKVRLVDKNSGVYYDYVLNMLRQGAVLNQTVNFALSGTGQEETDYVVRLHLHSGVESGEPQTGDVFLNNKFAADFSDVAIYAGDTKLEHYLHSHGNYELIFGGFGLINQQYQNRIFSKNPPNLPAGLYYSDDNGANWVLVLAGSTKTLLYVTSTGVVFFRTDNLVYRSNDNSYTAWTEVLNTNTATLTSLSSTTFKSNFAEDELGNLYIGRYQLENAVTIFKSTDEGLTWVDIYHQTTQQHVHGIYSDTKQTPNALYVVLDGAPAAVIKSVDHGANWSYTGTLPNGSPFNQICSTVNYRFLGGELYGVIRTSDDITWELCHHENAAVSGLFERDGIIYATLVSYNSGYRRILMSDDEGNNWSTIWLDHFLNETTLSDFYRDLKYLNLATYTPYILGDNTRDNDSALPAGRIYDKIAGRNQSLVYLKIPLLPADGINLTIKKEVTESVQVLSDNYKSGLLARYKCDEGSGTELIDSSGNNYHTGIGAGTWSWNDFGLRFCGQLLPKVIKRAKSINSTIGRFIIPGSGVIPEFNQNKNLTICFWIQAIEELSGGYKPIFAKGTTNTYFGIYTDNGYNVSFRYSNGSTTNVILSGIIASMHEPTFAALTLSNDDVPVLQAYRNGFPTITANLAFAPVLDNLDWAIAGGYRGIATIYTPAKINIADLQIYNRVLTDLEIRSIHEGRPISEIEPDVI